MALIYTHFQTFNDVTKAYDSIKPLGGAGNAGRDIRPIGDRRRKHERIVKISDSCYALSDGYHYGDNIFTLYGPNRALSEKDMEFYAPIVWRKHRDGTETVKVRNGTGPNSIHTGRYMFLSRHMPRGLTFVQTQQGKQFVQINGIDSHIFLAKGKTIPTEIYDALATQKHRWAKDWGMKYDDKAALLFKRSGSSWELISHNGKEPIPPRTVVDKKLKAKYKDAILAFRSWALVMTAMLDLNDWSVRSEYDMQFREWGKHQNLGLLRYYGAVYQRLDPELVREIVATEDHPMRLHLAVAMMSETELHQQPIHDQSDMSYVNVRLNRWINKALGFNTTVQA